MGTPYTTKKGDVKRKLIVDNAQQRAYGGGEIKQERTMSELPTIEEKAVELIEKFEALATDVAPDAIELGLVAARVAAAEKAFFVVVPAIAFTTCLYWAMKFIIKGNFDAHNGPDKPAVIGGVFCIPTFFFFVGTVKNLSIWPFVGIFYPELWIAKQVLGW